MQNKMQLVKQNTTQGGSKMKCSFCGKNFKPINKDEDVCEDCVHSVEELTNGKGEDEDDDE